MRRQLDCEEKRDPDLDVDRIKDENMELDPNARLEKRVPIPGESCILQAGREGSV